MYAPSPLTAKNGSSSPTPRIARTGELTPPGIRPSARCQSSDRTQSHEANSFAQYVKIEVGAGAPDRGQRLDRGGTLVEVARRGGGLHHRVLPAHVVGRERQVEAVAHGAKHVEVRKRGLHHQHVGAFGDVELAFAQRLAHVAGVELVAAPVAERGRRVGDVAERPVERRRVFRRVRHDRRLRQRLANGADPPVHHVARADDVGARLDVRDRGADEQVDGRVVQHVPVVIDDAAVPVRGVLAEAHVGHQHELRETAGAVPAARAGRSPSSIHAPEPSSSFSSGMPEEDHRLHAEADELLDTRARAESTV